MFIENKYHKYYYNIISAAKSRDIHGYVERHHIIPKSLGGTNEPCNIVRLTAREHFICHMLLVKMTNGVAKSKMIYAAWQLSRPNKHKHLKVTSRVYLYLREELSKSKTGIKRGPFSESHLANMRRAAKTRAYPPRTEKQIESDHRFSEVNKGKTLTDEHKTKISTKLTWRIPTEEHRKNISISKMGIKRAPFSEEWRNKISISLTGNKRGAMPEEQKIKISISKTGKQGPNKGIPRTEEVKDKIRQTKLLSPVKICPHCGKEGKGGNMVRYHFDNCKSIQLCTGDPTDQ